VYQQSQQPYPVLGDSLPEPIQEQLRWLLLGGRMGRGKPLKVKLLQRQYPLDKETLDRLLRQEEARWPQIWVPSPQPTGQANRR